MILSELIDLLETGRKLVSIKGDLDKKYFDEFIEPVWEKFVEIHKDYKTTLQEYIKLAIDNNGDISSFIEQIRQDSIYSQDLRSELMNMVKNLPSAFPKTREKYLEGFLWFLDRYFDIRGGSFMPKIDGSQVNMSIKEYSNRRRFNIMIFLTRKGTSSSKEEVVIFLQETMKSLQSAYESVSREYYNLKKDLLT